VTQGQGDTYALVYDQALTREQFYAVVEMLFTLYPAGWPDGETFTLPNGTTVRIAVEAAK